MVGDLPTVAPIGTEGTAGWWGSPRFGCSSVFASLLDVSRGGQVVLRPTGRAWRGKQLYFPDTNVLITRQLG